MNCWQAALRIWKFFDENEDLEIPAILESFPLEQKKFITSIKYNYSSILFQSVMKKREFCILYLLRYCSTDPDSFSWIQGYKLTCIVAATIQNSPVQVEILLAHGADVEIIYSPDEVTALYIACKNRNFEIAKRLIDYGANVDSHDIRGTTCLMQSVYNFDLCYYLLRAGADVNKRDHIGETALLKALKNKQNRTVSLLLDYDSTDVRLKNNFGADALYMAIKYSIDVDMVIRKGCYTREEVIKMYEVQSCLLHIGGDTNTSRAMWGQAQQLCDNPRNFLEIPISNKVGRLQTLGSWFHVDDFSALIYLESTCGLRSVYTMYAYRMALKKVQGIDDYILLNKFFFKLLHTIDDKYFFHGIHELQMSIRHLCRLDNSVRPIVLDVFHIFVEYVEEAHARLKLLTPRQRMPYGYDIELLLKVVIDIFYMLSIDCLEFMNLFHEGIGRIIKLDIRGLSQQSLLQLCIRIHEETFEPIFLECGADVNCRDKLGKCILNTLIETGRASMKIVKKLIGKGFDFGNVRYNEYCLPCRMKHEGVLPHPVKYISLQCLAASTFCKVMGSFNDAPYHLRPFLNSHSYF